MHALAVRTRRLPPVVAVLVLAATTAGCSSGSSGFRAALSRVADTANNRSQITYDDTAALVKLTGKNPHLTTGYAALRGFGADGLTGDVTQAGEIEGGFSVLGETYSISVGSPPATLTLLSGGQSASQLTARLTKLGWKKQGSKLVGPPPLRSGLPIAESAAQVQPSGSDVVFGYQQADLSQIGSPSGRTLAGDPLIGALADCLGNVVTAEVASGGYLGGGKPAAAGAAVGILQPASKTTAPRAVACVAWPSQAAAARYTTAVKKALASGVSTVTDEKFSAVLKDSSVTNLGGSEHVVRWDATSANVMTVFGMVEDLGLPGLPDCPMLTRAAIAQVTGCS